MITTNDNLEKIHHQEYNTVRNTVTRSATPTRNTTPTRNIVMTRNTILTKNTITMSRMMTYIIIQWRLEIQ